MNAVCGPWLLWAFSNALDAKTVASLHLNAGAHGMADCGEEAFRETRAHSLLDIN